MKDLTNVGGQISHPLSTSPNEVLQCGNRGGGKLAILVLWSTLNKLTAILELYEPVAFYFGEQIIIGYSRSVKLTLLR